MLCPKCQVEIDDAGRIGGRCPACGAALRPIAQRTIADIRRPEPVDPTEPERFDQTLDLPAGALSESVDIEIRSTLAGDAAHATLEGPPVDPSRSSNPTIPDINAPSGEGDVKPATVTFGPQQTIEFSGGSSAIDESMLTSQWQGGLPAGGGANLGATIKQKETITGTYVSSSSLIVKSRHVTTSAGPSAGARPTSPADAPDYELLNVIGEGGMGVVYAARQSSIARTVALKMLKAADADLSQRDKFISEAVVTGELDHPNIVPIYDLGANNDGALFYSMKRVKGTPWHKVLATRSLDENLNILLRVADAVAFAHANGVVHRDLKPENVMLGDFGEVLVMDWGLARVNAQFPSHAAVTQSDAMGGTPAYMAPEMATGPLERITPASDIYLLGAILYEIITGRPPHTGKTVMACLFSAAKNQIAPTDKTGELVEIALKAMNTKSELRHESVQHFQAAVREYQAHAESLRLQHIAEENLARAAAAEDYELYARATYALEESLTLWPQNRKASALLAGARIEYARLALGKGDYDLGASLLDPADADHQPVLAELTSGRRERESRQRRIRALKGAVAALIAAVIGIVGYAYVAVSAERDEAITQRSIADKARGEAEVARTDAVQQRDAAQLARRRAETAEAEARQNYEAEQLARRDEAEQRRIAQEQTRVAVEQRTLADTARADEAYAAYVARIGVADANLQENSFERAAALLAACPEPLRNWEWGRLKYLTQLADKSWRAAAPVDAAAFSPDGVHFATGGWDGAATIWNLADGSRVRDLPQGQYVHAVAYDAHGRRLAAGSSDGTINIYDAATGERLQQLRGHEKGVLSVRFSPDGQQLLSGSYDHTARLWDLATGESLQTLAGHTWWVWAAEFSPDSRRILTVGQDGKAIVWQHATAASAPADGQSESGDKSPTYLPLTSFTAHTGAVYAGGFSPTENLVATAGHDGRVLLWNPDRVEPVDVGRRIDGLEDPPAPYRTLAGHRGPVRSLAFAPGGKTLASGGQDNAIFVWNVADGSTFNELRGHASHVRACSFSPDGALLLSAGRDAQVNIWRPELNGETRALVAAGDPSDAVLAARFSRDGSQVVTASRDRTASLWDAATLGRRSHFQEGHDFLASAAAFFPDGTRLATAAGDGTVRLWDVAVGGEISRLDATGYTAAVAVSDNGRLVATSSSTPGEAIVWDAETGGELARLTGHNSEVTAVAFAPGAALLATGDNNGHCRLWNYQPASKSWTPGAWLRGHSRTITALRFVDGGARLISASGDNSCGQWDVNAGREIAAGVLRHPDWVADMVATPDGQFAFTACDDGKLRLWNLATATIVRTLQSPGDASVFTSIDVSSDGRYACAASAAEGTVQLWNLATGDPVVSSGRATDAAEAEELPSNQASSPPAGQSPSAAWLNLGRGSGRVWAARFAPATHALLVIGGNDARLLDLKSQKLLQRFSPHGIVAAADLSPDGGRIVTGSWDRTAKIWDATTGNVVAKLPELHAGAINSVCYSPRGDSILTASADHTLRLWDATTGEPLEPVLRGHAAAVRHACFSPDGSQILSVSSDKTARLWDAATGRQIHELAGHEWAVLDGAFSGDGKLIITGGEDNAAIIWNAATGEHLATLRGHTAAVAAVALTPDGTRALTGSQDNYVKLWDAATGAEVLTLQGHADEVTSASFSPDGRTALTSSRDGRTLLWPSAPWDK